MASARPCIPFRGTESGVGDVSLFGLDRRNILGGSVLCGSVGRGSISFVTGTRSVGSLFGFDRLGFNGLGFNGLDVERKRFWSDVVW